MRTRSQRSSSVRRYAAPLDSVAGGSAVLRPIGRGVWVQAWTAPGVPSKSTPRQRWLVLGVTLLAAFTLTLATLTWVDRPREADLSDLIAALPNPRPYAARLSGGFPYAPCERPEAGEYEIPKLVCAAAPTTREQQARLNALRDDFFRYAGHQPEARRRHLDALWTLTVEGTRGNLDRAIADLEAASKLEPESGAILSDLAAAFTARAAKTDDARDLVRALDAAEKAAQASLELPEALWNRAVGREVWDASSAGTSWALFREAETHLGWASAPEIAGSPPVAPSSDSASKLLAASHLAHLDALQASTLDQDRRLELALTRRMLVRGFMAFEQADYVEAHVSFRAATGRLAELRAPLAGWATYWSLRSAYRRGLYREVLQAAPARIVAAEDVDSSLVARLTWVLASAQAALGLTTDALASQQKALAHARQAGDRQIEGCLHTRLAGSLESLGRSHEAWQHRLLGLRALRASADDPELATALAEAVHGALDLGALHAAIALQSAELMRSQASGEPLRWMLALQHRAELVARLTPTAASELLASVRREALAFPNPEVRRLLLAQLDLTEAPLARAEHRPDAALARVDRAVEFFRLANRPFLPRALLERARIHRSLVNPAAARADLQEAVEIAELLAGFRQEPSERAAAIEQLEMIFHELLDLELEHGDSEEALNVLERSRGRELLEWLARSPETKEETSSFATPRLAQPLRLHELAPRLGGSEVFVVYQALEDELLGWVIQPPNLTLVRSPLDRRAFDAASKAALSPAKDETTNEAGLAALYDTIVRPVLPQIVESRSLYVVPGELLSNVPFAALLDRRTGRHLVEDFEIAVLPSLTAFAWLSNRSREPIPEPRLLVVADPSFDRELFPGLPRLRSADLEATEIARRFPGTRILRGLEATPEALLSSIGFHSIVHLAAHGLVDQASPLSSALVLAPPATSESSGLLRASDLLAADLSTVQLAVLVACGSAGRGSKYGVAGLVHPFLARGVPQVVAVAGPVGDEAAAGFFSDFYSALHRSGSASHALRETQLSAIERQRETDAADTTWMQVRLYGVHRH